MSSKRRVVSKTFITSSACYNYRLESLIVQLAIEVRDSHSILNWIERKEDDIGWDQVELKYKRLIDGDDQLQDELQAGAISRQLL